MKKSMSAYIRKFLLCTAGTAAAPNFQIRVDVHEEYANAFRTESYNEFWTRVLALSDENSATYIPVETSTAARLPSYRLFVEHLLDPDQPTVTRILALAHNPPAAHSLLTQYFNQTANASLLCGSLLKDIDHTRVKYSSLKITLQSMGTTPLSPEKHFRILLTRITEFTNSLNPCHWSAPSPTQVRATQADCSNLLKKLESSRDRAKSKLQMRSRLKHGSALFLVALTASLTVILATHALALVVAAPSLIKASLDVASSRRLARVMSQLDMAAKGSYILSRDLETISRLVARLNDELEHMRATVKFWVDRGEEWIRVQANGEVMRRLKKNDCSFSEQLDEAEEHLYLCFMTINRARNLVLREILDPGQPIKAPNLLSK
ncbi:hypothetical protein P3X46_023811 [Hevea brasiliensis]|uniref:Uncharacterized protein n=1 Tax=Hevea brasiliensis TaxID=3981 RepID=A0ABQ9LD90_HEVBR|nr:UPF0496 protein At3g49070 [Hevea brasiliensis]KAJ9164209.1 hypothetical protein P3X46_023811 [Hevea brasiliensis]